MNYKKKYVNSLNNLKKKRIRFIYLGKQFKKKNCPLKVLKLHLQNKIPICLQYLLLLTCKGDHC